MPFINDGEHVSVVEVSIELSLSVIVGVLVITVIASLVSPRGRAQTTINNARRHAREYLDLGFEADPRARERGYHRLLNEEAALRAIPPKYHHLIREEEKLMRHLAEAHATHDAYIAEHPELAPTTESRIFGHPDSGKS